MSLLEPARDGTRKVNSYFNLSVLKASVEFNERWDEYFLGRCVMSQVSEQMDATVWIQLHANWIEPSDSKLTKTWTSQLNYF